MQEKVISKKSRGIGSYLIAIIFLVNPSVGIFDILPDFVSYLILMKKLAYGVGRVPYFAETRRSLGIMALISLAKLPAFLIMSLSNPVGNGDTKALFALTFCILEVAFVISALNNLFAALFYLGERSDATCLISPLKLLGGRCQIGTDTIRKLTFAFTIFKSTAYVIPELCLLSRDPDAPPTEFNFSLLYPYAVVLSILMTLIFGVIVAYILYSYVKAVAAEGKFRSAIDGLLDEGAKKIADKNDAVRKIGAILMLFTAAAFLTLELRFDNFDEINLLPRFLYGIIIFLAVSGLARYTKGGRAAAMSALLFTVVSAAAYIFETSFLYEYGYSSLASSNIARDAYIPVILLLSAELSVLILVLVFIARMLSKFVILHTGLEQDNERYTHHDALYHKKMKNKVYIWLVISVLASLSRLVLSVLRYFAKENAIMQNPLLGTVTESVAPWFGLVVLIFSVINIGYSIYLFSILKDEMTMKYSEYRDFSALTA